MLWKKRVKNRIIGNVVHGCLLICLSGGVVWCCMSLGARGVL